MMITLLFHSYRLDSRQLLNFSGKPNGQHISDWDPFITKNDLKMEEEIVMT